MQKRIFYETEWFAFNTFEMKKMRDALIPLLPRYEKKINRLKNHPDNEGQATFLEEIDTLKQEQREIRAIVDAFRT